MELKQITTHVYYTECDSRTDRPVLGYILGSNQSVMVDAVSYTHLILIDSICYSLHPQIIDKIILPNIRILADRQGSNYADLLTCCECFVDCCMNVKNAAEKASIHRNTLNTRLSKLKSLTGLDPINSFQDALTLKLLAVYVRQMRNLPLETKGDTP